MGFQIHVFKLNIFDNICTILNLSSTRHSFHIKNIKRSDKVLTMFINVSRYFSMPSVVWYPTILGSATTKVSTLRSALMVLTSESDGALLLFLLCLCTCSAIEKSLLRIHQDCCMASSSSEYGEKNTKK